MEKTPEFEELVAKPEVMLGFDKNKLDRCFGIIYGNRRKFRASSAMANNFVEKLCIMARQSSPFFGEFFAEMAVYVNFSLDGTDKEQCKKNLDNIVSLPNAN